MLEYFYGLGVMLCMIQSTLMSLSVETLSENDVRWFSVDSCVVHGVEQAEVFVGGKLIGTFGPKDILARNLLLVGLSKEKQFKKGKLAWAFNLTDQQLRRIRQVVEEKGTDAIPSRPRGGSEPKVTEDARKRLYRLFNKGMNAQQAFFKVGKNVKLSYRSFCRVRQEWESEKASHSGSNPSAPKRPTLPSSDSAVEGFSDEGVTSAAVQCGKNVSHLGGLLLVALIHSYGLYEAAMRGWSTSSRWRDRLRMAIDAVVLALGIGQKCVEGVRRLETPTAPILLRCNNAPSESWVRRIIKQYVDGSGMANKLHLRMTGVYLDSARSDEDIPVVFYVDNHMRSYTGKKTIRKGWRMQDKRSVPGVTDYYVHDEDGRPVFRVEAPSHDALTDWLSPIAELMRGGLDDGQRVLLAFDRAGAFPENMSNLRNTDVEFVTYERKPYRALPKSAFNEEVAMEDGEVFLVHEKRLANLGKKRGRVRRICLLAEDGRQVNLLAVSKEPAWRLIEIITGRWVQENGFKHGKERWGINQLDRRKVVDYAPGTTIPNPARRRLELSIKIAREQEGRLHCKLDRLDADSTQRVELEALLEESQTRQAELAAQRPHLPKHASVEETELAGKLTYHDPHYKTVIDTIRIACANAESDLAFELGDHLRRPAEAKKVLANIFNSQGNIRVNNKSITITLAPAARKDERRAIHQLLQEINTRNLTLPGDPETRPLRFKSNI